jgi:hypothetical protein
MNNLTIDEQKEMLKYLRKAESKCPENSNRICNNKCLDCWIEKLYENIERNE